MDGFAFCVCVFVCSSFRFRSLLCFYVSFLSLLIVAALLDFLQLVFIPPRLTLLLLPSRSLDVLRLSSSGWSLSLAKKITTLSSVLSFRASLRPQTNNMYPSTKIESGAIETNQPRSRFLSSSSSTQPSFPPNTHSLHNKGCPRSSSPSGQSSSSPCPSGGSPLRSNDFLCARFRTSLDDRSR